MAGDPATGTGRAHASPGEPDGAWDLRDSEDLDPNPLSALVDEHCHRQNPEETRHHGFIKPREQRGPAKLYTRMDRKVKAYWNILADAGMATTTIGWWMTYPPEQIPGLMVSQTNAAFKQGGMRKGELRTDTVHQV